MAANAEMPDLLRCGGAAAQLVQDAFSQHPTWPRGTRRPIWHFPFANLSVQTSTVELGQNAERIWGIHENHLYAPQPVPFVELPEQERPTTNVLTLEMFNKWKHPILIRAYFGPRVPPQPWMDSALLAPEGWAGCFDYWQRHAYLRSPLNEIRPGSIVAEPPEWWTNTRAE